MSSSRRPQARHLARVTKWMSLSLLLALWLVAGPAGARAASPEATPAAGVGDPRSSGQGPGLVGDPALAIIAVALIAAIAIGATLVYVRVAPPAASPPGPRSNRS